MKPSAIFFVALCAAIMFVATNSSSAQTSDSTEVSKVGPSMVWQPPQDFVTKAHAVCDKSAGPANFPQCFINQMPANGAPAGAVAFARMYYQQSSGQVAILTGFKNFGSVDAAQVFYPLRANDNYGLLLVNGSPKVLDVDELKKLDQAAMQQNSMFQAVKQKYANTDIWPGDRSGSQPWPRVEALPSGEKQFIVSYPLLDGCHACRRVGQARYGWNFDSSGKFLGTTYIPTPPPPKLMRPHGPAGSTPQQ